MTKRLDPRLSRIERELLAREMHQAAQELGKGPRDWLVVKIQPGETELQATERTLQGTAWAADLSSRARAKLLLILVTRGRADGMSA